MTLPKLTTEISLRCRAGLGREKGASEKGRLIFNVNMMTSLAGALG